MSSFSEFILITDIVFKSSSVRFLKTMASSVKVVPDQFLIEPVLKRRAFHQILELFIVALSHKILDLRL